MALEDKNNKDASVVDVDTDTNVDLLEDEEEELEGGTGEDKDITFEEEFDLSAVIPGLIDLLSSPVDDMAVTARYGIGLLDLKTQ